MSREELPEVFSAPELIPYFAAPILSLGLPVAFREVLPTLLDVGSYFSLLASRSQQGQLALSPIVEHGYHRNRLISKPVDDSNERVVISILQQSQLFLSDLNFRGSVTMRFDISGEKIDALRGIHRETMWSIDHARTSSFENEIRAAHDLPFGDISYRNRNWMTIEFDAPQELNMVQPYRHLSARNSRYRFHHFDSHRGVISLEEDQHDLREELIHATDYLEGVINE
mgnify:FL=1